MSIANKLLYLNDTREKLLTNINAIGGNLTEQDTFRSYADELDSMWEAMPHITGEGETLSLSTKKGKGKAYFLGDTIQDGTPSPTTPVAVETVTGEQIIQVVGTNLLPSVSTPTTHIENGVTFIANTDGSYRVKGTLSSATSTSYNFKINDTLFKKGTYYIHLRNSGTTTGSIAFAFLQPNTSTQITYITPNQANRIASFTLAEDTIFGYTRLFVNNNMSGTFDVEIKPSIEYTSNTTDFNEYTGNIYKINLGKNLFDKNSLNTLINYYVDSTGKIVSGPYNKFCWVKLQPNKTYTLSQTIKSNVTTRIGLFTVQPVANSTGTVLGTFTGTEPITQTFTTTATAVYLGWVYCNTSQMGSYTEQDMLDSIQLEKGSQATSYSEYKTPIELCKIGDFQDFIIKGTGKNKYDPSFRNSGAISGSGFSSASESAGLFSLKASASSMNIWGVKSTGNTYDETCGKLYEFEEDTYSFSVSNNLFTNNYVTYFDQNNYSLGFVSKSTSSFTISKSDVANAKYFTVRVGATSLTSGTPYNFTIQLEKGSQSTPYEPYGLVKDKWYLYKTVDDITYVGTESWSIGEGSGFYRAAISILDSLNLGQSRTDDVYCTHFKNQITNSIGTIFRFGYQIYCYVPSGITTTDQWKTWLSSNNMTVYYPLGNPTTTEITDTNFIEQLENAYRLDTYEGVTNILQESANMPFILNVTALSNGE